MSSKDVIVAFLAIVFVAFSPVISAIAVTISSEKTRKEIERKK